MESAAVFLLFSFLISFLLSVLFPAFFVPAVFLVSSYRHFLKIDLTNLNYLPQFPVSHNTVFP